MTAEGNLLKKTNKVKFNYLGLKKSVYIKAVNIEDMYFIYVLSDFSLD